MFINHQEMHKLFIFDLETTGFPKKTKMPRIVSIGYYVISKGKKFSDYKVVKVPFKIPGNTVKIHGITNKISINNGIPIHDILTDVLKQIKGCTHIISHNLTFDLNILLSELRNGSLDISDILRLKQLCTCRNQKIMKYFHTNKLLTLEEMYNRLFNKEINSLATNDNDHLHNSLFDATILSKCVCKLFNDRVINFEDHENYIHDYITQLVPVPKGVYIYFYSNKQNQKNNACSVDEDKNGCGCSFIHAPIDDDYPDQDYILHTKQSPALQSTLLSSVSLALASVSVSASAPVLKQAPVPVPEVLKQAPASPDSGSLKLSVADNEHITNEENIFVLPVISLEQKNIIEYVKRGDNVVIDAVAGSGKTTSILYIAKECKGSKILCLTYNSKLKLETRDRASQLALENLEVHSYHAFGLKYYTGVCKNDNDIINILNKNSKQKREINFDIIIFDEMQDMNNIYYDFALKLLTDNKHANSQMIFLGDQHQSIYNFKGASKRYLTLADKLFGINNRPFSKTNLHTSYRVTKQIAEFINKCVLNEDRIISTEKSGPRVCYWKLECDDYFHGISVFEHIKNLMSAGYAPEDFFILAPSVASKHPKHPLVRLENALVNSGILCFVPDSDEAKIDETILNKKVVFSSFHQVKGLERKIVFVYNFDASYFAFYNKKGDLNPEVCPSTLYVAITRAKEHLIVLESPGYGACKFINTRKLKKVADTLGNIKKNINKLVDYKPRKQAVIDFIKFVPIKEILYFYNKMKFIQLNKPEEVPQIDWKTTGQIKDTFETVSVITGTAIPAYYECITQKKITLFHWVIDNPIKVMEIFGDDAPDANKLLTQIENKNINALLELTTIYHCASSGYIHKGKQIKNFDWLDENVLDKCIDRIKNVTFSSIKCEVPVSAEITDKFSILGKIDGKEYDPKTNTTTIWEYKCVNELTVDNFIQLAVYAFCYQNFSKKPLEQVKYKLFNIISGEIYELIYDDLLICELIDYIYHWQFDKAEVENDKSFFASISDIREKYKKIFKI